MAHFAKVINNRVVQVLVAEQDVIDSGIYGDPGNFIQTSYNTIGNVHYGPDGQPDGGIALRGNYASEGDVYDAINDVFYGKKPYPSWILNEYTWLWEPPIPIPTDGKIYSWDEKSKSWIVIS